MKAFKKMEAFSKLGHLLLKLAGEDTEEPKPNQLKQRLKEEVSEMQMYQFSADNSEQRLQWSAIGPIYCTYYNMIESMIVGELKNLRAKYLYVAHQLSTSDYGGTICNLIIKPHNSNKIYRAAISITVSVLDNNQVDCVVCREVPENANIDLSEKGTTFKFDNTKNLESMSTRMMASANMLMTIHNIMQDIDNDVETLLNSD